MTRISDLELLGRLVAIDSTSALGTEAIASEVCAYLEAGGVETRRLPGPGAGKVNVVARTGRMPVAGEGLTLSGHLDTVPAREPQWTSDPFTMVERDGACFGRGTCDMKGFVALAVNLLVEAAARGDERPLCLLLTCDEELGSLGARCLVERPGELGPVPRATVIGEPTSLRVVRMHKGHLKMCVTLHGRAAHTGSPHLGVNAIEPAGAVIAALAGLRRSLENEPVASGRFFPEVPFAVLALVGVEGGEAANVVPERCTIDLGIRLLPGQRSGAMIERVDAVVRGAAGAHRCEITVVNDSPPMELREDAAINRRLCEIIGQRDSHGVSFSSDGGPLQELGLECVLFGPGTIEVAHRPDEFVPIAEMARCREVLERLIMEATEG